MKTIKFLALILITVFLIQCIKIEQLPPEPRIEFTSFTIFDTIDILGNLAKGGRLKFYFEDGDGDLGLNEPGFEQPDTANLFLTLFRKTVGQMEPVPDGHPLKPTPFIIPYIDRQGQNKILKGTIAITFFYRTYSESDTIMYEFYVKDRAQNESNTVTTTEIIISENDIYR